MVDSFHCGSKARVIVTTISFETEAREKLLLSPYIYINKYIIYIASSHPLIVIFICSVLNASQTGKLKLLFPVMFAKWLSIACSLRS